MACDHGHDCIAEMLLQAGASVELKTKVRWCQSRVCSLRSHRAILIELPYVPVCIIDITVLCLVIYRRRLLCHY